MKSFGLAALVAGAIFSAPAFAADMRMPMKAAPMVAPAFNWSGFYIGGFVGGAGADRNATSTEPCSVPTCVSLFTVGGLVTPNSYSLGNSFIGGGTIGYNWQAPGSPWVFGLEGEAGYLHLQNTVRDINAPAPNLSPGGFDSTKIGDVYGVIAGRLGYSVNQVLFYAKGGVAFVEKSYDYSSTLAGPQTANLSNSHTQTTWAAGGGIEWAFARNWSVKGEYLYIDTRETYNASGVVVGGPFNGTPLANTHTDPGVHTGKFGINYRF